MNEQAAVRERGYAKINLHLDIIGRMTDGYHQVETVMQTVSLYDELTWYPHAASGFDVVCNVPEVPTDARNLAVRAARLYAAETGMTGGGRIVIQKQIPMAAGMAGGSTDAAAILRAMNRQNGNALSLSELCRLGSRLGADVPFCLTGGTAYADGRGDLLHAAPAMPPCYVVMACAGEGVSTPWAYRLLDTRYGNFESKDDYQPHDTAPLIGALKEGDLGGICTSLYNIFEDAVLAERPVAAQIRNILRKSGAAGAMMSGSGPSVFGIFSEERTAQTAAAALAQAGYTPYRCRPISSSEVCG